MAVEVSADSENKLYRGILDNLHDGVYFVDKDCRITYWNDAAERITGYAREDVIGRKCSEDLLMHTDDSGVNLCIKGCPAERSIVDGKKREELLYVHHKDGYRVPVIAHISPMVDENGSTVGAIEIFSEHSAIIAMRKHIEELQRLAMVDSLTGVGNRRHAEFCLDSKLGELKRYGWSFGVIFIDVDYFKAVNDEYGHEVGDRVLKTVGRTLLNSVRSIDHIGRWGGEEFMVIVSNTNQSELSTLADKLRNLVEQSCISIEGHNICVTISAGATLADITDTKKSLVNRVDKLMYRSKRNGRNCVSMD